jgi:hypothetical protein
VVREQILIRLEPLKVRHPCSSRGVGASQRLEFAAQRTELFDEAGVFGSEICELFCAGQLSVTGGQQKVTNFQNEDNHNIS